MNEVTRMVDVVHYTLIENEESSTKEPDGDISTPLFENDRKRMSRIEDVFETVAKNLGGEKVCISRLKNRSMVISCEEREDLLNTQGEALLRALNHTAQELRSNANSENPLPPYKAVTSKAHAELLKTFTDIARNGHAKIEIVLPDGLYPPPILATTDLSTPSCLKMTKKQKVGPFEIRGVESGVWGGNRALIITRNQLRVMITEGMVGFELERLIDTLHEQSYLHGTITQDPESREWRIDPGAMIHSQKALPLDRDR